MSRGSGPARMGVHLRLPTSKSLTKGPQGNCKRWQFAVYVLVCSIFHNSLPWKSLVPPEKLQDSHDGAFLVIFWGRFSNLKGCSSWISFDKSQDPSTVSQLEMYTLDFVKFLCWARNLICWASIGMKSSPVSTITFLGKTKMLSKKLLFKESSIPKYFLVIVKNRSSADPKNRIQEHCNQKLHTANLSKMAAQQKGPVHPVHLTLMKHPTKRRLRCFA